MAQPLSPWCGKGKLQEYCTLSAWGLTFQLLLLDAFSMTVIALHGTGLGGFPTQEFRGGCDSCLGCVCKTTEVDAHSHVHNARICTEGPVFEAGEVDI